MTAGRSIDYETLAQEAMRGVVRQVLMRTAKSGLPGDHHFYVSFDTQISGVVLSKRLKEKYPAEMTIVLQHRFWDLSVTDDRFEVKLKFDGFPERLVVPFAAIKVFFDPSVRYGLQFDDPEWAQDGPGGTGTGGKPFGLGDGDENDRSSATGRAAAAHHKRPMRKPRLERVDSGETSRPSGPSPDEFAKPVGKPIEVPAALPEAAPAPAPAAVKPAELKPVPAAVPSGAQIVSLSDFRKK